MPKILSLEPKSFIQVFDNLFYLLFMNEGIFEPRVFKKLSTIKKLYQVSFTARFSSQFSQLPENPLMQKGVDLSWPVLRSISGFFDSTTTASSVVNFISRNAEYDKLPAADDEDQFEHIEFNFPVLKDLHRN